MEWTILQSQPTLLVTADTLILTNCNYRVGPDGMDYTAVTADVSWYR